MKKLIGSLKMSITSYTKTSNFGIFNWTNEILDDIISNQWNAYFTDDL